jgi:TonB family protein
MSEIRTPDRQSPNASAGHLEVRIEGAHPADLTFLFEQPVKRIGPAAVASAVYHVAFIAAIVLAVRYGSYHPPVEAADPVPDTSQIIWLNEPGPGGGGGGGGNRMKEPPRRAQAPGEDKITIQVQKPPELEMPQAKVEPPPLELISIPAQSLADAQLSLPGAVEGPPGPPTASLGSGSGGGAGTGVGTGIGPGTGSGLGPGSGGGTGGGVYRVGNGVTAPRLLVEVQPKYTSDAMRARVQGIVVTECVILPDGSVGDVKVIRAPTPNFGLDQEAIKAVKKWKFSPGTLQGRPVAVLGNCELDFTLR